MGWRSQYRNSNRKMEKNIGLPLGLDRLVKSFDIGKKHVFQVCFGGLKPVPGMLITENMHDRLSCHHTGRDDRPLMGYFL